jgi:uncharacterized protein (TIGR02391 family)
MIPKLLERIRALQEKIREVGLAGESLSLPAPKVLLLPSPLATEAKEEILFSEVVTEPEIVEVARDLFVSGFYNQAVMEAFKALDLYIQDKVGRSDLSGTELMQLTFSTSKPLLSWTKRKTLSEQNEQKGYQFIYSGSFLGIRSPCTHAKEWIDDDQDALDVILLAQHLLRKAKTAALEKLAPTPA